LTTKPGTSLQVMGCLRIACAKLKAVVTVSREVSSPLMISTSGITEAGKKKWKPTTFSGRSVSRPISVMESDEVFEARIAWPGVASSSSA
jgi:electron transfer flavoprotein alpha/beta subunit